MAKIASTLAGALLDDAQLDQSTGGDTPQICIITPTVCNTSHGIQVDDERGNEHCPSEPVASA